MSTTGSCITDLEMELSRLRIVRDDYIILKTRENALQVDYKRIKRQLEKQRKSNRRKQDILQQYRDKYGMLGEIQ